MLCPLCKNYLLQIGTTPPEYICHTRAKFGTYMLHNLSHYEDRDRDIVWYLPPYKIVCKETKSIISVVDPLSLTTCRKPEFKFVMETISLPPDNSEKMVKRIKTLITFS